MWISFSPWSSPLREEASENTYTALSSCESTLCCLASQKVRFVFHNNLKICVNTFMVMQQGPRHLRWSPAGPPCTPEVDSSSPSRSLYGTETAKLSDWKASPRSRCVLAWPLHAFPKKVNISWGQRSLDAIKPNHCEKRADKHLHQSTSLAGFILKRTFPWPRSEFTPALHLDKLNLQPTSSDCLFEIMISPCTWMVRVGSSFYYVMHVHFQKQLRWSARFRVHGIKLEGRSKIVCGAPS